jgi:imidazolonepropionase-like amidohydrolase
VGEALKAANVPVIIQGTHVMPRRDDSPVAEAFTLPLRLHQAGVAFCLAYADDTAHERNLPYAAATAVAFGLPQEVALRSVTLSAAEILGVADRLGSLEVGKAATLIITTGDPLDIRTETRQAFIDGREIDLSNKQRKLYEKYRERYRQLNLIPAAPGGQ